MSNLYAMVTDEGNAGLFDMLANLLAQTPQPIDRKK